MKLSGTRCTVEKIDISCYFVDIARPSCKHVALNFLSLCKCMLVCSEIKVINSTLLNHVLETTASHHK